MALERRVLTRGAARADIDEGLRAYMLRVYNYMTGGLAITGLVALVLMQTAVTWDGAGNPTGLTSLGQAIYASPLQWLVMLAPLAFVLVISFGINKLSAGTTQLLFWLFAAAMGASLSSVALVYTTTSIARVFFIAASVFGVMSLYGYTTKRDLTGVGQFMFMGLIGIVIASVVNMFLGSTQMQFIISIIGVIVFVGLTAYDTQNIKNMYLESDSAEIGTKKAVHGALRLYLDFINIFVMLLSLFGDRR
ncbi:MAG: Bax inhibitor-1/YccA family protein [Rhodospirillaceae bacterium]|mgnify:CR=1 FL=1|jgi:uncharacterized protein|nr:Bax inhibitor-1/YccA family protein [Rhodospirillaceae bacterium]MBT6117413.1 Bax inhibitor-1/YccA family protein [Rhodospirillaceae bacterium]